MSKLLASIALAAALTGCFASHARQVRSVEAADPVVGDLHCAQPRMTIIEALYEEPASAPVQCDAAAQPQ